MKRKSKNALVPDRKVWIYSAHDETLANFLMTLDVFDTHCPPYAATVLVELRENSKGKHVVTVRVFFFQLSLMRKTKRFENLYNSSHHHNILFQRYFTKIQPTNRRFWLFLDAYLLVLCKILSNLQNPLYQRTGRKNVSWMLRCTDTMSVIQP